MLVIWGGERGLNWVGALGGAASDSCWTAPRTGQGRGLLSCRSSRGRAEKGAGFWEGGRRWEVSGLAGGLASRVRGDPWAGCGWGAAWPGRSDSSWRLRDGEGDRDG